MKKLPKKFSILAREIEIIYEKSLGDNMGLCCPDSGFIKVIKNKNIPVDSTEATLFHEIAHYITYSMGEEELYRNEKFIDLLGQMMHQLWKTLK